MSPALDPAVFITAIDVLDRRGWWDGRDGNPRRRACGGTALNHALNVHGLLDQWRPYFDLVLAEAWRQWRIVAVTVPDLNDNHGLGGEDIRLLFKHCAQAAAR